jgi:flagellar hook-associated protein 2
MGISMSGVGSGFDWQSLIDQLTQAEQKQKITPLTTQKTKYQDKLTAWQSLATKLSALQTVAKNLTNPYESSGGSGALSISLYSDSTVPASSLLTATKGSDATAGNYQINITKVALSQKIRSTDVTTQTSDAGWSGTFIVEGHAIDSHHKSLQTMRDEVNALNTGSNPTGVTASITMNGTKYRLVLTHDATGAAGMNLTDNTGKLGTVLQAGQDADFSIDSESYTSSSNTIADAIDGVVLHLRGSDAATTLTLEISAEEAEEDTTVRDSVQAFVVAYNDLSTYISQQMSYDITKNTTGGALFGDSAMKSIKNNLQSTFLNAGTYTAGLTVDSQNKMSLDIAAFDDARAIDPAGTLSLFTTLAQNMYDQLDDVTDSIDGPVTLQEKGLQDGMSRLDGKITRTQEMIDRRMEMMKNQYINLDSALSAMQSQQSWLTSQLSSLSS